MNARTHRLLKVAAALPGGMQMPLPGRQDMSRFGQMQQQATQAQQGPSPEEAKAAQDEEEIAQMQQELADMKTTNKKKDLSVKLEQEKQKADELARKHQEMVGNLQSADAKLDKALGGASPRVAGMI